MQKIDKETIIFFVLVIFLILEIGFLLPSGIKKLSKLNKEIGIIKKDIAAIKSDWPRKDSYLENNKKIKEEIKKLKSKFILPQQESKLFSFLSEKSKDFKINIESLKPLETINYTSGRFGKFKYLPISIESKGKFHNLGKFLDYLQKSDYFFEVKELYIKSDPPHHYINMTICGLIKEKK
jgi:Tfp pilus assembly protein PilO